VNRRNFLKTLAGGSAAVATIGASKLLLLDKPVDNVISDLADFTDAKLKRKFLGEWELSFHTTDMFDPTGKNDLIVEIDEFVYRLFNPKEIEVDSNNGWYHYTLGGRGYERISPPSIDEQTQKLLS